MNIKEFFADEKIEYFFLHRYDNVRVIKPQIMEREGFIPRSVIIYLVPYFVKEGENLSTYAVSRDYHIYIKALNERLVKMLSEHYPKAHFKGYGDHSPIDEREAAATAGLGVLGKNGLLINEKYGSYIFIGEVMTDISPEELGASDTFKIKMCEGCDLCIKACPTGALCGAGKCLSDITQRKGELVDSELELMLKINTVWGCDECQRACPHNKEPKITPIDFFHENVIINLTESALNSMSDAEFKERAYSWRGRKTIERNIKK